MRHITQVLVPPVVCRWLHLSSESGPGNTWHRFTTIAGTGIFGRLTTPVHRPSPKPFCEPARHGFAAVHGTPAPGRRHDGYTIIYHATKPLSLGKILNLSEFRFGCSFLPVVAFNGRATSEALLCRDVEEHGDPTRDVVECRDKSGHDEALDENAGKE